MDAAVDRVSGVAVATPRLAGRVAMVTGGNTGIGAAVVRRLAVEGASVLIGCHEDPSGAERLAAELSERGPRCLALPCDVTAARSVGEALREARARLGEVTMLVNNAAILERAPFLEIDEASWERVIRVSLHGAYTCSRLAIPGMLRAGSGAIVNVTSELTSLGGEQQAHYVAAKSGIVGLTRSLAREFGAERIRVNAVAPGPTRTQMLSQHVPPEFVDTIPLRRLGRPEDMGGAVAFLCSDDAAWVTGQTIGVNGGITMT